MFDKQQQKSVETFLSVLFSSENPHNPIPRDLKSIFYKKSVGLRLDFVWHHTLRAFCRFTM